MNETLILNQVRFLYEHELYSNIMTLSLWLNPVLEKSKDVTSPITKYQMMVYIANSNYQCKEYKKAEAVYRSALQLRKSVSKTRGKQEGSLELLSADMDVNNIKYQIHLCHVNLKQCPQAIAILESIPAKLRTSRVNMALGKLYQQSGQDRSSITAYKEVVKECPLALEAAKGLLSLGVKRAEVSSLMLNTSAAMSSIEWLPLWIKAQAQLYSRDYGDCLASVKQLELKMMHSSNADLLVLQGEANYYNGDYKNAEVVLERACAMDPYLLKGMDIYALLLARENKIKELDSLSTHLIGITEDAPEPWFAMAVLCKATKKNSRAVYFAQKACIANPRSVEALLLKGFILIDLKKLQEAAFHFREALNIAPYRYKPHKGLVECHMAMGRTREAITTASNACKQLGSTPRALTLYASVLAKDQITKDKARSLLEKALKIDGNYLPALYKLIDIYEQDKEYDKGIELLKKQIEVQSSCKLHSLLAELLCRAKDNEKALDHYNIALNFEPNNARVLEGMHRVEQQTDLADSSYDVDDVANSDDEEGIESSEFEAVWSNAEFS